MRLTFLLSALVVAALAAPTDVQMPGHKVTAPPTVDGNVDADEWRGVPSARGFVDEETGKPAEPGDFFLAYDSQFIYFAAKIETDPKGIRATEYRQNVSLKSDESVYLVLEPFGGGASANQFGINPRGATEIKIAGGRAAKREWLGEFQAAGRVTETGYEVEARIPWSIMRLPAPAKRDLRVMVMRYNPRLQRRSLWVYLPNGNSDMPYWRDVDVPAAQAGRSLKLLPYVYGGWDERNHIANAGLDFKTSVTDQVDLVGTVNPDFRNVENQILSLDFSYFERLAKESRPFFLEGGDFFRTAMDMPLFASQRILKFDFGMKSFGQLTNNTKFGVLNTIDFGHKNNFVGSVRHQMSENSGATAAVTSVADADGSDNVGTFLSIDHSKDGLGVFAHHMTTRDTQMGGGHRLNTGVFYERDGWDGYIEYIEVSEKFMPRLGFAPERDFRGFGSQLSKSVVVPKGPIMEWEVGAGLRDFSTFSGAQYRRGGEVRTSLTFRDSTDLDVAGFFEEFRGSKDHLWSFSLERPRGDNYRRWQVDYQTGRIDSQRYDSYSVLLAYRPLQRLQLSLTGQEVHHFDKSTQVIVGANYDIGRDMSLSGRAVRRGRDVNAYLAFRKSGGKGAEYYVILGDPNAQTFQRALVIKAVIPLEFKL